MNKVISIIVGVVALAAILGSNWNALGSSLADIGQMMTGAKPFDWLSVLCSLFIIVFVLAIVIFIVWQLVSILKGKKQ